MRETLIQIAIGVGMIFVAVPLAVGFAWWLIFCLKLAFAP